MTRARSVASMIGVSGALLLGSTGVAGADPTQHFVDAFDITCGGDTYTVVSKPGSSNVLTVNGEPSNSVAGPLFGITVREGGEVVFEFQRVENNPNVIVCEGHPEEPGVEVTLRVIITPPEQ
jgi:hypothetical protein